MAELPAEAPIDAPPPPFVRRPNHEPGPRRQVWGIEDVVGPVPMVAPIGGMLTLMRTPMMMRMIMIAWNRAFFLCQVATTLRCRVPATNFVVLATRLVLFRALSLYPALALLSSSRQGSARILILGYL